MTRNGGRVWTALVLGAVGFILGIGAGLIAGLVIGSIAFAVGWHIAGSTDRLPAESPETPLVVREPPATPLQVYLEPGPRATAEASPDDGPSFSDDELNAVTRFLGVALAGDLMDHQHHRRLMAHVARLRAPAPLSSERAAVPVTVPQPPPPPPSPQPSRPPERVPGRPPTVRSAPPMTPPRAERRWGAEVAAGLRRAIAPAWESVRSDVAVHGLAYLGVLLVFVATFGFVVFAFTAVDSAWRPVAEAAIPIALFGGARFLRGRGAPFVSASIEFLAGAVTPIVVFAAFADGAAFPPDLEDAALVGLLSLMALGLAAAYAAIAAIRPTSPLRFLVAPMLWLAAGTAGLVFEEGPSAAQFVLVAWAVVATAGLARTQPRHRLARPTFVVTGPGLVLAYALVLVFAASTGWPPLPILFGGLALVAAAEVVGDRLTLPWAIEGIAVATTAGALAVSWPAGWVAVGSTVAFLGLAELWAARGSPPICSLSLMTGAIAAVAASSVSPESLLAASLVGAGWSHWRRLQAPNLLLSGAGFVGGWLLPLVAAGALAALAGPAVAAVAVAGCAVAVAAAGVLRPERDEYLESLSAAYGALAAVATVALAATEGPPLELAAAAAFGTLAFVLLPRWPAVRVWAGAAGWTWTLLLSMEALGVATEWRPVAVAVGGGVAVVAAWVLTAGPRAHLSAAGYVAVAGSLAATGTIEVATAALAIWVAAWIGETVAVELDRSPLVTAITTTPATSAIEAARGAPALVAVASAPVLVGLIGDVTGLLDGQRGRLGVALASVAVVYALLARLTQHHRPLAPILSIAGFALAYIGIAVAAPAPWPTLVATAAPVLVTVAVGTAVRRQPMVWAAWATSGVLAVLAAERTGVDPEHLHLVLGAWGAALTAGALVADDARAGRRRPGAGIRSRAALAPSMIGSLGVPIALAYAFTAEVADWWPWGIAGAGYYFGIALLLRAGSVTVAGYSLLTVGTASALAGTEYDLIDHPVLLVPVAAVLLGWAAMLDLLTSNRDPWLGWAMSPLVVAHGVAAIGLIAALDGQFSITYAGFGALSLAVAAWQRSPAWGAAGDILVLIGAAVAGPGWLALALGTNAAAFVMAAVVAPAGPIRTGLNGAAAASAAGAWVAAIAWGGWWPDPALPVSTVAGGGLGLLVAGAYRFGRLRPGTALPWALLGLAASVGWGPALGNPGNPIELANTVAPLLWCIALAVASTAGGVARSPLEWASAVFAGWSWAGAMWVAGWWPEPGTAVTIAASGTIAIGIALVARQTAVRIERLAPWIALAAAAGAAGVLEGMGGDPTQVGFEIAAGLALWAGAAAIAARRLGPVFRHVAVVLAGGAAASLGWALGATYGEIVAVGVTVGIVASFTTLGLWALRPEAAWREPAALAAAIGNGAALLAAADALPDTELLVLSLAAAGVQALAAALVTRMAPFAYVGLTLLLASWLTFASGVVLESPHWYAIPIGVAVLAQVDVARWDRHRRGADAAALELQVADYIGMSFIVGWVLAQTVTTSIVYGVPAMLLGGMVVGYGSATRVRRRCYFGAGVAVVAALAMLAVPLVEVIPQVRGIAVWATVAAIGTLLILIATYLERGRTQMAASIRRLEEITGGWE